MATLVTLLAPNVSAQVVGALADVRLTPPWLAFADAVLGAGVAGGIAVGRGRRRPAATVEEPSSQALLPTVQAIVDAHGTDSLAPFVVRPDKSFGLVGDTVIAYRRVGRTLVVSGDPVGPTEERAAAFAHLRERCAADRLRLVVYAAGPANVEMYRRAGMRVACVGEEAVVDPAAFTLEGRAVRKVRQSVQRVGRRGWTITALDGREVDDALMEEIEAVEREWRTAHRRVLGFAMSFGPYEHGARPDDLLVLARSPEGELRAVMRFLSHRGNLSLDTMRRTGATPNGLNEALVCRALAVARERGVAEVSLNYAGLAHLLHDDERRGRLPRAARRVTLRLLGTRFQLQRLVRFNEKFGPVWRPRYLVYESRRALPGSIVRVLQAEGYVPSRHCRECVDGIPERRPARRRGAWREARR